MIDGRGRVRSVEGQMHLMSTGCPGCAESHFEPIKDESDRGADGVDFSGERESGIDENTEQGQVRCGVTSTDVGRIVRAALVEAGHKFHVEGDEHIGDEGLGGAGSVVHDSDATPESSELIAAALAVNAARADLMGLRIRANFAKDQLVNAERRLHKAIEAMR